MVEKISRHGSHHPRRYGCAFWLYGGENCFHLTPGTSRLYLGVTIQTDTQARLRAAGMKFKKQWRKI